MTKEDFTTVSINDRIEDNIESNETTTERTNTNATTPEYSLIQTLILKITA